MRRLLYIDDDKGHAGIVVNALESRVQQVEISESGTAGLRSLRVRPYDVCLISSRLQDMTGFELLQRARRAGIRCPIVVISKIAHVEDAYEAGCHGAAACLTWPLEQSALRNAVSRVLEASPRPKGDESIAARLILEADVLSQSPRLLPDDWALNSTAVVGKVPEVAGLLRLLVIESKLSEMTLGDFDVWCRCVKEITRAASLSPVAAVGERCRNIATRRVATPQPAQLTIDSVQTVTKALGKLLDRTTLIRALPLSVRGYARSSELRAHSRRTIAEWHRIARLHLAVVPLVMTTEHVCQIADAVGYPSHAGLDHHLAFEAGLSPKKLRALIASLRPT